MHRLNDPASGTGQGHRVKEVPREVDAAADLKMMNILFVCTGNVCRSPMAAAYFNHLCGQRGLRNVAATSAGIAADVGEPMSANARRALEKIGVKAPAAADSSTPIDRGLVLAADLIVVMGWRHERWLADKYPEVSGKVRKLLSYTGSEADVRDPFGGSEAEYRACLACMQPAIERLAELAAAGTPELCGKE